MGSIGEDLIAIAGEIQRLQEDETDIRDALSRKGVDATDHGMDDYASDIDSIQTGGSGTDVSDTTAQASDVLAEKVFHTSDGARTEGTMANYSGVEMYAEDYSVADNRLKVRLAEGYYDMDSEVMLASEPTLGSATRANVLSGTTFTSGAGFCLNGAMQKHPLGEVELTKDNPELFLLEGYYESGTIKADFSGGGGATDTVVISKDTPNPLLIDTGIKDLKMFDIKIDRVGYEGTNCFSSTTYYSDNPTHYTASYHYSNTNGSGNTYALNGSQNANFFVVNSVVDGVVSLKPLSSSSWYGTATWTAM